jgi:uncharacterized protein (TIGR03437 family)
MGSGGVLYGTTQFGGTFGFGTVFSLTSPATPGGAWTEKVLHDFGSSGIDGAFPFAGVVIGSGGVLYGTTQYGGGGLCITYAIPGGNGCGTVFSLTPPELPGGTWTETVLLDFQGEGIAPGRLAIDSGGVLYGTTDYGGGGSCVLVFDFISIRGCGIVFSLTPPAAPGGEWTETVLYNFTASNGGNGAHSGLAIGGGPGGLPVLYMGAHNSSSPPYAPSTDAVFSLTPPTAPGGPWTQTLLYNNFAVNLGAGPNAITVGNGGVLYGTAAGGVFSLTPPATPSGMWSETMVYSFTNGGDGSNPNGWLAMGSSGLLYGVTLFGPSCGTDACGTIFLLVPPTEPGGTWTETTLHSFTGGSDGGVINGGLAIGGGGVLYGTTQSGGTGGSGTVFSLQVGIPQPSINAGGLVSAASYAAPVAPGSIASVFGDFFVPAITATQSPLPASLSGLSLQFDFGPPAPLFFASGGQVNFQVPWELAFQSQANLAATLDGQTGAVQTVNLAPYAPAIFTMNAQGSGQGAILDASNHLVDSSNPATPGSTVIQIFCTGLGTVSYQPQTGSPAPLSPLAYTGIIPTVRIGGVPADVWFSGLAPGYVGLYQVNAQVPAGLAPNRAVPVVISMEGIASNTVTIAVE